VPGISNNFVDDDTEATAGLAGTFGLGVEGEAAFLGSGAFEVSGLTAAGLGLIACFLGAGTGALVFVCLAVFFLAVVIFWVTTLGLGGGSAGLSQPHRSKKKHIKHTMLRIIIKYLSMIYCFSLRFLFLTLLRLGFYKPIRNSRA
jgi:hypothetical protein